MTTQPDLAGLRSVALELAGWAAGEIASTPAASITTKAHAADLVTDLDRAIENRVRERLAEAFPEHGISGEEFGSAGPEDAEFVWYCDPIDGTTNYANGIGWCSFSLCCWDSQGPLVGVVADPFRRELFHATRGQGAVGARLTGDFTVGPDPLGLDGRELTAHAGDSLAGTVLTTEWLAHRPWPGMIPTLAALAAAGCTVRIMGSSALSMIQAATGRAAGCIIGHWARIDDSAAALVAAEAGAVVCDRSGRHTLDPAGSGVLVAGPGVVAEILACWKDPDYGG